MASLCWKVKWNEYGPFLCVNANTVLDERLLRLLVVAFNKEMQCKFDIMAKHFYRNFQSREALHLLELLDGADVPIIPTHNNSDVVGP